MDSINLSITDYAELYEIAGSITAQVKILENKLNARAIKEEVIRALTTQHKERLPETMNYKELSNWLNIPQKTLEQWVHFKKIPYMSDIKRFRIPTIIKWLDDMEKDNLLLCEYTKANSEYLKDKKCS